MNKRFSYFQFIVSNLVMGAIVFGCYKLNIVSNLNSLPRSEYFMIGFLLLQWFFGQIFVLTKHWQGVYYIANTLPIWGLICLSLTVFNVISGANVATPEVAFAIVKGAGLALLINAVGVFLMLWLKKLAYFCGGEHV